MTDGRSDAILFHVPLYATESLHDLLEALVSFNEKGPPVLKRTN
jgi:hypothetical protein